ncbi:striatin-3-like [Clavelina lepadiformis]|uniref:striatin-3-like n=1 Tax=Clavelina lepadiformis TaxID=159417 RepID=UPI0040417A95
MDLDNEGRNGQKDAADCKPAYSMPGILHFIQHEWSRFEMDRAQWDVERAELHARIAFLQGERKGQENLKRDLIRRIKMLEFALKQERSKVHKLKFGTDLHVDNRGSDSNDESRGSDQTNNANMSWRHGRQLLRQYLQEVGYSDTILDVRSQRVRALLGNNYDTNKTNDNDNKIINGDLLDQDDQKRETVSPRGKGEPSEHDVLQDFNFLSAADNDAEMESDDITEPSRKNEVGGSDDMNETEVALAEFAFLNPETEETDDSKDMDWAIDQNKLNAMKEQFRLEKRHTKRKGMKRPDKKNLQSMLDTLRGTEVNKADDVNIHIPDADSLPFTVGGTNMGDESIENALGLGALAGLTVANEADPLSYEISANKDSFRKTWNPKYTLRSHFDGVRAIRFLPNESAVITASEDHTMKLWNLNKPLPSKKTQSLDVEPIYSFRGHIGPVLCLEVDADGVMCYSGGLDASIRCWKVPSVAIDAYDTYDSTIAGDVLIGHTDAVWSLSYSSPRQRLLSAAADMSVRLWNPMSNDPLVDTINIQGDATPTCVEFVKCDTTQGVVSLSDGRLNLFDLETGKILSTLAEGDGSRINYVVSHPTMPLTITAHDDRHIKFFDHNSGELVHSMVAHLDSVTSLSVDPNGLYLLSGSHDCSIRLWNLDTKTCIQELTSHRKKFDESIYSVAFHPSATYIASAGADALAKVFV